MTDKNLDFCKPPNSFLLSILCLRSFNLPLKKVLWPYLNFIMASELQSQLNVIRKQNIQAAPLHQGRASLFLTRQEAAAVDVRTVYDAAVSGLNTLKQYDGRFEAFLEGLLHPSSIEIQRELKTREENDKLDVEIARLLKLIALFAHEESAHLVLEYLIRRFRINEVNPDLLLKAMLVTHDTNVRLYYSYCISFPLLNLSS